MKPLDFFFEKRAKGKNGDGETGNGGMGEIEASICA
jgi:hypothetical protein